MLGFRSVYRQTGSNPEPNHACFRSKTLFPVFFLIQISLQVKMRTKEMAHVE
jgi:hypothetical protein